MFTIMDVRGNLIVVRAEGRLSAADYARFVPEFEGRLASMSPPILMLLALGRGFGWTPGGLWCDLRFNLRHRRTFARLAVTGHRAWHRGITAASKLLFTARIRYFPAGEAAAAERWLVER